MADYQVTPTYCDNDGTPDYVDCTECEGRGSVDEIGENEETGEEEVIGEEKCAKCEGRGTQLCEEN